MFHCDAGYLEGRYMRKPRSNRVMSRRTDFGRELIAQQWAATELHAMMKLWQLSSTLEAAVVPYPVQILDTELPVQQRSYGHRGAGALMSARLELKRRNRIGTGGCIVRSPYGWRRTPPRSRLLPLAHRSKVKAQGCAGPKFPAAARTSSVIWRKGRPVASAAAFTSSYSGWTVTTAPFRYPRLTCTVPPSC